MIPDFAVGPFILMYHAIDDATDDPYSVSVAAFHQQMSWLSENGFEVVSLSFLLRSMQAGNYRALRKKVVITFDDGNKDFITNALPILLDSGGTATVFLVTSMFGGRASWNRSEYQTPLMSEDEVRSIKARGISLGSHTATHAELTRLNQGEVQRQLKDSHDALTHLGESFYSFAYPWGQWSSLVADAVRTSGYACALAAGEMTGLSAANVYSLPRIAMRRDVDIRRFQTLLTRTRLEMGLRRGFRAVRQTMFGASGKTASGMGER